MTMIDTTLASFNPPLYVHDVSFSSVEFLLVPFFVVEASSEMGQSNLDLVEGIVLELHQIMKLVEEFWVPLFVMARMIP